MRIEAQEIPQRDSFRYLGSIISMDGEIDVYVEHRILAFGVLCDRRMPTRLKEECYITVIRQAMTYGAECWSIKKQNMDKMDVAEMTKSKWMCGKNRKDKIKNECFQEHLGVHQ